MSAAAAPRILVVDDSATSRAMLQKQLARFGCQVECAEDGGSALAALARTRYDLVLLDCYMPDMNGYQVAREVRATESDGEQYTPLIGISAEADAAHVQLCLDSGMDGILGKPLPLDEFSKILALWCDVEIDGSGVAPILPASAADVAPVDLEALFHSTSLEDLAQMRQCYARGDISGGRRMAHRMKGAALTMQRGAMVEWLERIEAASAHAEGIDMATIDAALQALADMLAP